MRFTRKLKNIHSSAQEESAKRVTVPWNQSTIFWQDRKGHFHSELCIAASHSKTAKKIWEFRTFF